MEILVENFDEVMNGFEVKQVVVRDINTNAKVEASISPINDLKVAEFNKVCVLCITD